MTEQTDPAKEMPLSVAFIRVFSVVLILIGIAEFIVSGIQMEASNNEDIGGIYFAATAVCGGSWGLFMIEGVQQFNVLSLLLFANLVASIVGVVYASVPIYIIKRIKACAAYDLSGSNEPRCEDGFGSYSNFTCSGNSDFFIEAAQCSTTYQNDGKNVKDSCGCVYTDGGTHCKEFAGYSDCDEMQDSVAALSMGTYVLGYMCLSLSFLLLVSSCTASCMHKKRRGVFGSSEGEPHRANRGQGQAQGQGFFSSSSPSRGQRVSPGTGPGQIRMVPVQASPGRSSGKKSHKEQALQNVGP